MCEPPKDQKVLEYSETNSQHSIILQSTILQLPKIFDKTQRPIHNIQQSKQLTLQHVYTKSSPLHRHHHCPSLSSCCLQKQQEQARYVTLDI